MGLHFLDGVSILFVRFGMLFRAAYCLIMADYAKKSVDKTMYRGEYKGYMGVFLGSFKLTPSMLGQRLVVINWFIMAFLFGQLFNIWKEIARGVVR